MIEEEKIQELSIRSKDIPRANNSIVMNKHSIRITTELNKESLDYVRQDEKNDENISNFDITNDEVNSKSINMQK